MSVNATYLLNNPRYLLDHLRNNDIFYNYLFKNNISPFLIGSNLTANNIFHN